MDKFYEWNFDLLYKNNGDIEADIKKATDGIGELSKYEGKLNSKENILSFLASDINLMKVLKKLNVYAFMRVDKNSKDNEALKLYGMVDNLLTNYSLAVAFVDEELAKLSDEFLDSLIKDNLLSDYKRYFESVKRNKAHMLDKKTEEIMANVSSFADFSSIFDKLSDTEIKFDDVVTASGEHKKLNNGTYGGLIRDNDPSVREQANVNLHKGYANFNLTISQNYISHLKCSNFSANIHKFNSRLDQVYFCDEIDQSVLSTLIKNVQNNVSLYQKYLKTKAKLLGLNQLKISDLSASVVQNFNLQVGYDDAMKTVLDMVKILGSEYYDVANKLFNSRWVDVYPAENKASGGYSINAQIGIPFILLNYNNTYNDVSTVAHELGHSIHCYFSEKNQPYLNQDYSTFVAEIASTVNEVLLAKKLLAEAKTKEEKLYIIDNLLNEFSATVFRQTLFTEFECFAHGEINKGNSITGEDLNNKYMSLLNEYMGDAVKFHDYIKYEWSRIPHFYRDFYVASYATGFVSAVNIASKIMEGGETYVKNNYLKFLSAGCSDTPVNILKLADVDITTNEPYDVAFAFYNSLIDGIAN